MRRATSALTLLGCGERKSYWYWTTETSKQGEKAGMCGAVQTSRGGRNYDSGEQLAREKGRRKCRDRTLGEVEKQPDDQWWLVSSQL